MKGPVFHAFTINYPSRVDLLLTDVVVSDAFDPKKIESLSDEAKPKGLKTRALWDTGATRSVITPSTVEQLGLIPTGSRIMQHAGGSGSVNTYVVNIILPNNVGFIGVSVSECDKTLEGFGVIIGMDIISQGDFALTNVEKRSIFSFRIPSIKKIDYVEEANKLNYKGTRPNDPCPCGSGKKFKVCCGSKL